MDDAPHPADVDDRPRPARGGVPDLNAVAAVWDDVVAATREAGRTLLATALEHASPVAVTAQGLVTVELDDANEFYMQSIEAGRGDVLAALRASLPGVARVELKGGAHAPPTVMRRISDADIRSDRLAKLRTCDPVLSAAIDALDLDVMD